MNSTPIRVLLIEDNPGDAFLLQEILSGTPTERFTVVHVQRLAQALERLQKQEFDIILSDLGLPDSHGSATFTNLHRQAPHIPIIVLSGLDDEELAVKTVHAGAQDYLVKGQVPQELLIRTLRYAIERSQTQEQLRQQNEQMAADLNMACEFQRAFLPRQFPAFPPGATAENNALQFCPYYHPSGSVGGDFYSVLQLGTSRAGVFICDVMGHGVRAALVTAIIRGLVEELQPVAADPAQFLTAMNDGLVDVLRQTDTTMFATAFYMTIDATTGLVNYVSAGHPSPFHLCAATQTVEPFVTPPASAAPLLGVFEKTPYTARQLQLQPGDSLLLYTDGVFEVPNAEGTEYGQERLQEAVRKRFAMAPADLFTTLLAEIQGYSGKGEFADDVCLLNVKFARRV